jgi:hypothetical protein
MVFKNKNIKKMLQRVRSSKRSEENGILAPPKSQREQNACATRKERELK